MCECVHTMQVHSNEFLYVFNVGVFLLPATFVHIRLTFLQSILY